MDSLQTAKQLIESLSADSRVIEIAGPTPPGNEFLQKNDIKLAASPLITNRQNPALFCGMPPYPKEYPVDEVADIRRLTYRNVDMFICSYLSWYSARKYNKKSYITRPLAGLHYRLGYTKSRANLHISLFRETAKALGSGGLLLVEGLATRDLAIAQKCGFTIVYYDADDAVGLFRLGQANEIAGHKNKQLVPKTETPAKGISTF